MNDTVEHRSRVKNAGFTRGRPFAKGNAGRPKGARNKGTLVAEALLQDGAGDLMQRALEDSKKGYGATLRWCLDRLMPKRDRTLDLDLPPVVTAADAAQLSARLIALVAEGEITPAEARTLATLVEGFRETLDTAALQSRVAELEQAVQFLRGQVSDLTLQERAETAPASVAA
jgi:hypothetical protein